MPSDSDAITGASGRVVSSRTRKSTARTFQSARVFIHSNIHIYLHTQIGKIRGADAIKAFVRTGVLSKAKTSKERLLPRLIELSKHIKRVGRLSETHVHNRIICFRMYKYRWGALNVSPKPFYVPFSNRRCEMGARIGRAASNVLIRFTLRRN